MRKELFRYLSVGLLNTSVGLSLIYFFMYLGVGDILANFIGYSVGFIISYIANSIWTFSERPSRKTGLRYFGVVVISYGVNISVMTFSRDAISVNSYIAQLIGVVAYTICGYLGARFYVFNKS
ncbi:GtrA family protein [Agrobacterium sp. rho-8.1]